MRIGTATVNQTPLDWKGNTHNIIEAIREAKQNNVELLCLPELCITGYGCEDLFLSNWLYERALEELLKIIPECKGLLVAIGLPIKFQKQNYNCACLINNAEIVGFYAKQNMALDGVHYEPRWFIPWQSGRISQLKINGSDYEIGDITYDYKNWKIGFEICEDAWRQDRPACRLVERGVNLILNPSASHFAFGKTEDRQKLIINSSIDFKCTYVYSNLLGNEAGRMIYDGEMMIAQNGRHIQRNSLLSFKNTNFLYADVEPDKILHTRNDIAKSNKNEEFAQAASLALFDYLRKSRSKGFTLSLSGGADSSTIAILVSEMVRRGIQELGLEEFKKKSGLELQTSSKSIDTSSKEICSQLLSCAYQGTKNSSTDTLNSAKELADEIGAKFYHWTIDEEVGSYTSKIEKALGRKLSWETDDIALQNIQARSRSPIIWMMANIKNNLLLTTSNRSEGDVGYATMDGDTSGSISPIAAVDKYFIIHWLKWAEKELGYSSLRHVNSLAPSAELRPLEQTQTDEADLMPYHIIVEIERLAIREHNSPIEVYTKLKAKELESADLLKAHIAKFYRLWSRNQWKRERIAPSFHLDDFNVDPRTWCRFPILSKGFEEELEELNKVS
ncbi:NAD(+) synthase [Fulvivirga lutea]|uniref:Glutamine-dependent NAD(+) synthetase n=1 Tax=Fulvivirga lutea TaxID=2810512 RepID=A0A974WGZ5_9BACT|nr:NAD(+) synthase [Fulvivirga lutea]QSE96947.1 NAD(+) synthase [Fulvivirga lutea]